MILVITMIESHLKRSRSLSQWSSKFKRKRLQQRRRKLESRPLNLRNRPLSQERQRRLSLQPRLLVLHLPMSEISSNKEMTSPRNNSRRRRRLKSKREKSRIESMRSRRFARGRMKRGEPRRKKQPRKRTTTQSKINHRAGQVPGPVRARIHHPRFVSSRCRSLSHGSHL